MSITQQDFISIVGEYKGNLRETEDEVIFTAKNRIKNYYESGEVAEDKIVSCKIAFDKICGYPSAEEETCRILGGVAFPRVSEEDLRSILARYNFAKQEEQQLSFL